MLAVRESGSLCKAAEREGKRGGGGERGAVLIAIWNQSPSLYCLPLIPLDTGFPYRQESPLT